MKHYFLPLAAAVVLTACGGGGGQDAATDPDAAATAASNAFFASVLAIVNGTSETSETADIDSVSLGSSETLEPSGL